MTTKIRRVAWNPWIGQSRAELEDNLRNLIWRLRYPHLVILNEVWDWPDTVLGYQRVEGPRRTKDRSYRSTIILVRRDGHIRHQGGRQAPGDGWVWNGNSKEMRVFPRAIVHWPDIGVTTDDIGIHRVPGGPRPQIEKNFAAWKAEHKLLTSWVNGIVDRNPHREVSLGGDWNASLREPGEYSLRALASSIGAHTTGIIGIDGFMTVNGEPENVKKLKSKYGSDGHHPVLSTTIVEGR